MVIWNWCPETIIYNDSELELEHVREGSGYKIIIKIISEQEKALTAAMWEHSCNIYFKVFTKAIVNL